MKREYIDNLSISTAPHLVSPINTGTIMKHVLIALCPALCFSVYIFGLRALIVSLLCVASCMGFEYALNRATGREDTVKDLSAAVTGLLLAFNLPSGIPYWMAVVGSFVAIIIIKGLFGGLGQNLVNPAITARVVLLVSFAGPMTKWQTAREGFGAAASVDGTTAATPLGILSEGGGTLPSHWDLFWGFVGGSLGETCAFALLLGGAYLVFKKIISPVIPVVFIGTVFVMAAVIPGQDPVFHILAGGVMIGAIFMATDYVTTPFLTSGKIIFAVGCGLLTMLIRVYGNYPEGVSFAILIMNILTPFIDKLTIGSKYKGGRR